VKQHNEALVEVLKHGSHDSSVAKGTTTTTKTTTTTEPTTISVHLLCWWHAILTNGILEAEHVGVLRGKGVRAGITVFAPADQVPKELKLWLEVLNDIETKMPAKNRVGWSLVFAAVAMFGLSDIHPFVDGNGRMGRLIANWALRRGAGLPFSIPFCTTPAQRREYVNAMEQTRANLKHPREASSRGNERKRKHADSDAFSSGGFKAFEPLTHLLADRTARAIVEFHREWRQKNMAASEEAEARAARNARERAARGNCVICFDSCPNIATLCCGSAVHLNCMAEWLSRNASCVVCRGTLPPLPPRMSPSIVHFEAESLDDTTSDDDEEDDTNTLDDDDSTAVSDGNSAPAVVDDTVVIGQPSNDMDDVSTTEIDETTSMLDDMESSSTTDDIVDTSSTTEDDGTAEENVSSLVVVCNQVNCKNRPALDCANGRCGKCCVLYGNFRCTRHNC